MCQMLEEIISKLHQTHPNFDESKVRYAYDFAKKAHEGQTRRSGEPYIDHPLEVAHIVAVIIGLDATAVIAALLHDVVEDTEVTYEDIKTEFSGEVALLVDGVTKLGKIQYTTKEEQQMENLRKMFLAMAKDIRVVLIKLADRLHNMRTLGSMPEKKRLEKAKETLDVYAPLAHRLGISTVKSELEDLSLKYLDPVAYKEINDGINQKKQEREEYIQNIMADISARLSDLNIKCKVAGRAKHFYSIFRKMYTQNKTLDEIYDLFAVRIIVDTIADCYSVLGAVHEMYKPIPMRFKDYIAMPKPNMYQSLHSTVIGPNGTLFEIQIRTWEMHRVAEYGIAAHWKYKEGVSGMTNLDSKLEWVRQLLEMQDDVDDTDVFMNALKIDMFADEVFVFTPKGDVFNLPAGSTTIDFAFAVHSAVGCKMTGAKVNGKITPIEYILQNGDIVEILTSSNVRGPSRDWLKVVKTSQARNKINQWFKKERREENILRGKELLEKELKRLHLDYNKLFRSEWLEPIQKRHGFNSIDDLYASVGYGGLTAQKVIMRLHDEYQKVKDKELPSKEEAEIIREKINTPPKHPQTKRSNNGIIVKGIDNCLVRLAKCCSPVPGDDIKGFITKGRGVSVHRADCPNIQLNVLSSEDRDRFIEVKWENGQSMSYNADINIIAYDRDHLLADIIAILSDLNMACKGINARVNKKNIANIHITVDISDNDDLKRLNTRLMQLESVIEIIRDTQ